MKLSVPGYKIEREIGLGGMSRVFAAIQESLERLVALKVISPALAADPTFTKRFLAEAKVIAQLDHPNIVKIHDIGVTADTHLHYFAMQYLEGGDLSDKLKQGLGEQEVIPILQGIAGALGVAHERGYIHRDVKPSNIMFDAGGNPVLTDFGIVRALGAGTRMTGTGVSVGTAHYMSPEQARGKEVDKRADLYSLGVVAYEALCGKPPFEGEDGFAVAYSHVYESIPRLPPHLQHWQAFIDRALAKRPEDRFATAEEMSAALGSIDAGNAQLSPTDASYEALDRTTPLPTVRRLNTGAIQERLREWYQSMAGRVLLGWGAMRQRLTHLSERAPDSARVRELARDRRVQWGAAAIGAVTLLGVLAALWPDDTDAPDPLISAEPEVQTPQVTERIGVEPRDSRDDVQAMPAPPPREVATVDLGQAPQTTPEPATPEPRVDTAAEVEINVLLAEAAEDLAENRLTTPEGDNAFEAYERILELAPGHPAALEGLAAMVDRYLSLASDRLDARELVAAATFLERARLVARNLGDPARAAEIDAQVEVVVNRTLGAYGASTPAEARRQLNAALALQPDNVGLRAALDALPTPASRGQILSDALDSGGAGPQMLVVQVRPFELPTGSGAISISGASKLLAVGLTEVTVGQFRQFAERSNYLAGRGRMSCRDRESRWRSSRRRTWEEPGFPQDDDHPVVCVDWDAAQAYVDWLSAETGEPYRLPSEAEWEFLALRNAGTASACARDNVGDASLEAVFGERSDIVGCSDGFIYTAPARAFRASGGLHGLLGNVREWVADCGRGERRQGSRTLNAYTDSRCDERIAKGASWFHGPSEGAAASRAVFDRDTLLNTVGFRVVRDADG